ncbi:MAG: dihydroneopterin aldolase [Geitlerinemataceae cyanobacterium]
MDAIEITGLRYYGYVGYFPEEQVLGQWFEVDLTLWLDLSVVGKNDELEDTLNYAEVVDLVRHHIETAKFKTVERLNTAIVEAVLDFKQVQKLRSRLVKVSPPIPGFGGQIAIEMTRTKDEVS